MSTGTMPDSATLAAWLEWAAGQFSDQVALLSEESDPITHSVLHHCVVGLRGDLRRFGVGRGDRVAILLPQGPGLALAFLAVAASATAAPLNPASSAAELETTLLELQPRALILARDSVAEARSVAMRLGVAVLDLDPNARGAGRPGFCGTGPSPAPAADNDAVPSDVALVLNTSGTTSRPKRVPLSHANLLASAGAIRRTLGLGPGDRGLCVMPLFHIHGLIAGLLAPLGAGGSVVCAPAFNPDRFLEQLARWTPTWYTAVPTMHQAILARVRAQSGWSAPATLRLIRSSSSALPPPVMVGLEAAVGVPVIESYGMTEASHQMASNPLPPGVRKPGSVGPAAGPEIAILGSEGQWAPPEVRGEVVIRGPGVTRGYENLPAGAPSPFHEGWFRTGDQGYLDPDGYLFLTGRLKELINRGGEKITPREIDEVLLEFPGVAQAVAFAVPHDSLGEDVAAAVVPVPGVRLEEPALREFAFSRLAAFKVPSRVLVVPDLPKGPSGKVQRIGLAKAFARELVSEFVSPESVEEREVAEIFRQVLGCDRVGRNDNFFSAGGDSLKATQAVNRLQQALGFEIPVATVFRHPTPALLAEALVRLREADLEALAAALEALPADERERLLREFA